MGFWRATLTDRDTGRVHDLGVYETDTSEEAQKKARNSYRALLNKLQTNQLVLDIVQTERPATAPASKVRQVDLTADWIGKPRSKP